MKLRKIDRTSTVAWSPGQHEPLLALGNVAGALDASFSSSTELELFGLNLESTNKRKLIKLAGIPANAR